MSTIKPLTIKQLGQYPPEASKVDVPKATLEGQATIAKGRDGPFTLHYKLYGEGPTKIVWISGHGAGIEDWYDMVREFGIQHSDRYTSLIFENRGIGQSEAPWSICSMKDLAQDVKDLLDFLQWTDDKNVHVVGHSMGGMMAMEFAINYPTLLASLTLMSTTTNWRRDLSLYNVAKDTLNHIVPKSADTRLTETKKQLFGQKWLESPDPTGTFPTNGDAWAARSITWPVHYKGAILQGPACVRHRVDTTALKLVAAKLSEGRVAIVQGWSDRMVPVATAERMWEEFGGNETGVKILVLDGVGHMPHVERFRDVVGLIEAVVNGTVSINGTGSRSASRGKSVAQEFGLG